MDYTPVHGFYDLREFDIPKKAFPKFVRVQRYLASCESARRKGQTIPDGVRDLSAQYQQALFAYEKKWEVSHERYRKSTSTI